MNVLIEIINTQTADGETQEIVSKAAGEFNANTDGLSLTYSDEAPIGGKTVVTLSGDGFISVVRTGSGYDTRMLFEKGKKFPFVYSTPYGEIMLETETVSVKSLVEDNGGFIEFEYDLLQDGFLQSHNRMKISFSEELNV